MILAYWLIATVIMGFGVTMLTNPLVAAVIVFFYVLWTQETVLRPRRRIH